MGQPIELFSTLWVRLTLDPSGQFVRLDRTAERMTVAALDELVRLMGEHVPPARRARQGLLIDARAAPMMSGDEDELKSRMAQTYEGFRRVAVLVGTAVGRLQASRMTTRQAERESRILVNDEAEAVAFLLA